MLAACSTSAALSVVPAEAAAAPVVRTALPSQAQHGQPLMLSGRVAQLPRRNHSQLRVILEQHSGRFWKTVARAKLGARGRFVLPWTAPSQGGGVTLRVTLVRGHLRLRSSRRSRVRLMAPAGQPLADDVGHGEFGPLPVDPSEVDSYNVTEGIGGPFSTRVPFANGMRLRVTQGQNGGYSHGGTYTRNAIDLAAGAGTPVLAGFSGVVAAARGGCAPSRSWGCNSGFGNFVYLKAADGTCALHAHLTAITVAAGQQVARYAQLGTVGSSGSSTGPHLHYDRIDCGSRASLPWSFEEAGQPREGAVIVSGNEPPPPVAPPPPPPEPPSPPARRVITVDNRVTNGMGMREDTTPARLTTKPWVRCTSRGCNINGTERGTGGTYDAAVCQTFGERTTNGNDTDPSDDANPERFESTRYYGVRLADATFGYVSEVWIRATDRGGLGLPAC